MLREVDWFARRLVAYPLVIFGNLLTEIARLLILVGAWIVDVEVEEGSWSDEDF